MTRLNLTPEPESWWSVAGSAALLLIVLACIVAVFAALEVSR